MKKFNVGDSVKFKDGRTGIVEECTDTHYIVKDSNGNQVKIKMVKDEMANDIGEYIEGARTLINQIRKVTSDFASFTNKMIDKYNIYDNTEIQEASDDTAVKMHEYLGSLTRLSLILKKFENK